MTCGCQVIVVLYTKKECAEQLRQKHQVSLRTPLCELLYCSLFTVCVEALLPNGRTDAYMRAVDLACLKGADRAYAMMRAITKAKRLRRSESAALLLVESELYTLPYAQGRSTSI